MNPMSVMKDADKLSVQQLQQALQDGSLPPYIGVPLLQQKVQEQKRMQAAMQAQQTQPAPPVAHRVIQEAQGLSALPSNLPTEGYADGGIIAFAENQYVDPDYIGEDTYIDPEEAKRLIKERYTRNPDDTWYNQIKNYVASTSNAGMRLPGQQENRPVEVKPVEASTQPTPVTQQSQPTPGIGNLLNKNAPNRQAPDVDQTQAMQNRIAARKAPPVIGGNVPAPTQTPYAQAAAPVAPATQTQPAQVEEKDLSLADYMKQYHDVTGENKGISALQSRLAEREGRLAKEEERAPWMALMQAGLATMAGTSPNALTNIGQGGVAGLQAYTHSMNKLEDAKDKSFEIQAKLEEAQRNEELAAAKYGLDSVQADKKAKLTAKLEREKMAHDLEVHKLSNATHIQAAEIQAGASKYAVDARNAAYGGAGKPARLTDQQRYYSNMEDAMAADPNYRRDLRLPNGKPDPAKLAIEYRKTFKDVQNEALFGGMGLGDGMMSAQPVAANTGVLPGYRILSQQ